MRASLFVALVACTQYAVHGKRFATSGPVLTVTVKDPNMSASDLDAASVLSGLKPSLVYNIVSTQPPLPAWLPSLKSLGCSIGYQFTQLKRIPSYFESTAKFDTGPFQLQVQPSHDLSSGTTSLLVQASRGAHYAFMSMSKKRQKVPTLDAVRASVLCHLPFASLSSLRITPAVNVAKRDITCQIEAITGRTTKAILDLEYERPTLAVLYQPDARNLLQPEIDLYSGKIVYQWITALDGGGNLRVKVDPVTAITATWTDHSRGSGTWVTDVNIPLENVRNALEAKVRVRHQFEF